jgi:predicted GH43/DUF377 family glycosyl hydrolase
VIHNKLDTRTPSILEQTPWQAGFYKFPKRYKVEYFNPGLVDWQNRRWLVTRRRRCAFTPAKNDITFWRLNERNEVVTELPLKVPSTRQDEHWEDPRAMNIGGQLWVSYSNFFTRGFWVHQGLTRVNNLLQASGICHPIFGSNGKTIRENTGHEKNWLWFVGQDGLFYMVYDACPHIVVRFEGNQIRAFTGKGFRWSKGKVRGGTPPVFVKADNLYWTFFHSSIDLGPTPPRRLYFMGAYAFEPEPPFAMVRRTSTPLLIGNGRDPRNPGAPLCVFPCGALLDGGVTWTVTLGVNDCACAWIKIPHDELWSRTIKIR